MPPHLLLHLISETDPRKNKGIFSNGGGLSSSREGCLICGSRSLPWLIPSPPRRREGPPGRARGASPPPSPPAPPALAARLPSSLSGTLAHEPAFCPRTSRSFVCSLADSYCVPTYKLAFVPETKIDQDPWPGGLYVLAEEGGRLISKKVSEPQAVLQGRGWARWRPGAPGKVTSEKRKFFLPPGRKAPGGSLRAAFGLDAGSAWRKKRELETGKSRTTKGLCVPFLGLP